MVVEDQKVSRSTWMSILTYVLSTGVDIEDYYHNEWLTLNGWS
jgi:hypothetical protein